MRIQMVVNFVIMEILEDRNGDGWKWKKKVELIDFLLFSGNIAINPNKSLLSVFPFAVFTILNSNRPNWMCIANDLVHRVRTGAKG